MEGQCVASLSCKGTIVAGQKVCQAHLERRRFNARQRRARYAASGVCVYCSGRKENPSRSLCSRCLEMNRRNSVERAQAKNILLSLQPPQGICQDTTTAKKPRRRSRQLYNRNRTAGFKSLGLCIRCGKVPPAQNIQKCRPCNDKSNQETKEYSARRKEKVKKAAKMLLEQEPNILNAQEYEEHEGDENENEGPDDEKNKEDEDDSGDEKQRPRYSLRNR